MKRFRLVLLFSIPVFLHAGATKKDTVILGVPLKFGYHETIFPASWMTPPINGKGESLDPSEFLRTSSVMATALSKYPASVLSRNLRAVYILKSISFYQVGYGGTNSNEDVYLTNNGVARGYTNNYIEQTFHHEFSSILYRNFFTLFNESSWLGANPAGFDYNDPENGVGAIRNNESSQELDTLLCERGFLTQYALSGLENDLNTVAQNLFRPAAGFWEIVDRYPRIRKKTRLLIRFYSLIDSSFSEEYFRNQ
jgi:hypothetical protein